MRSRLPLLLAVLALVVAWPASARADGTIAGSASARYRADEVVVRYTPGAGTKAQAASAGADAVRTRVAHIKPGESVAAAARRLARSPDVVSATPNYVAHIAGYIPPDPGKARVVGGWQQLQWNFLSGFGVDAPDAWSHLIAAGHPGGRGVTVAVLDTGIAYSNRGRYRRSPDFTASRFVRGYDFVDHDPYPNDENGHGTHVAGTIAETTGNDIGDTGLAYGVKLMPVRVLDRNGEGDSDVIAKGLRFAADHGAQVINLSFEFGEGINSGQIPDVVSALQYVRSKGVLVVAAAGNEGAGAIAYPARAGDVLSVGATTQHGCEASDSNSGAMLSLVAPGGGTDATLPGDPNCMPGAPAGNDIYQETFVGSVRKFGLPKGWVGTSMATPHVSATAALVIASGILGAHPTPDAIERRLELTATDLGKRGRDRHYGYGLVNAAAATDPAIPVS
jgi:serine protease